MKWLGSLLILSAFCAIAMRYLQSLSAEKKETERLYKLLALIRREIMQYQTPLPKIYRKAKESVDYPSFFWNDVEKSNLYTALQNHAEGQKKLLSLYESVQDCLLYLGKSEKETQLHSCEKALSVLDEKRKEQAEEMPKKIRLYVTVCLCIGGSLIILL